MKYRRLGQTGLKVSEIALGSSILYDANTSDDNGIACIQRAFDLGINLFDTADAYERGETERVLGVAVQDLPREQIVIATKCWYPVWNGPLGRGSSRKHIVEAAEHSLRRMRLDYIDLYQLHQYDDETPIQETLLAVDQLVRQGKVLYAGCSNFSALQLCDANHWAKHLGCARFDSSQLPYNVLVRGIEREQLPFCGATGVGVIAYSPLARGLLTGKYTRRTAKAGSGVAVAPAEWKRQYFTNTNLRLVQRLSSLAKANKMRMGQLALAWILRRSEVSSCIIGAQSPAQIEEDVTASALRPGTDLIDEVERLLAGASPSNR